MRSSSDKAWMTRRAKKKALAHRAVKAARTREYRRRQRLGHEHDLDAKKWIRHALSGRGWRYLSFESKKKYEPSGVVDFVAVRKRKTADPNSLEVRLLQSKGYGARVTQEEREELKNAVRKVKVTQGIAWKPGRGKPVQFEGMTDPKKVGTGPRKKNV